MSVKLLDLPNEVLMNVLYYLTPIDLLSISRVNERLEDLTCAKKVVWKINFKESRQMNKKELKQFFIRKRCINIIELDIRDCYTIATNRFWESCIMECQSLKALCVLGHKFPTESVTRVFSHLPQLEELSWSPNPIHLRKDSRELKLHVKNGWLDLTRLCKLSLYFLEEKTSYIMVRDILTYATNLEYIHLHPYVTTCMCICFDVEDFPLPEVKLKKLHSFLVTREYSNYKKEGIAGDKSTFKFVSSFLMLHANIKWKKLYLTPDIIEQLDISVDKNKILNDMAENNIFFSYDEENNFHLKSNNKHNYLLLQKASVSASQIENIFHANNNIQHLIMKDVYCNDLLEMFLKFKNLFFSFPNIVELNLLHTHFCLNARVVECISCLKALKILSVQSCAILSQNRESKLCFEKDLTPPLKKKRTALYQDEESLLLPLVNNCADIQELNINGCTDSRLTKMCCSTCGLHIIDKDLIVVSKLVGLQSLTLRNLPCIRQGNFLQEISTSCKNFKRLSLHKVGNQGKLDYMTYLSLFLRDSLSIVELVINHGQLNLGSEVIWTSLVQAKSLERICLKTNFKQTIELEKVKNIKNQLPNLTVFHIHVPALDSEDLTQAHFNRWKNLENLGIKNSNGIVLELIFNASSICSCLRPLLIYGVNIRHIHKLCFEAY